jgi:hypothetical protein
MPPKMEIAGDATEMKSIDKPKTDTTTPAGPRIVGRMLEDFRDREERRSPRGKWIDEFGRIRNGTPPK